MSLFSKKYKKSSLKVGKSNLNESLLLSVSSFELNEKASDNSNTAKAKLRKMFLPKPVINTDITQFPLQKSLSCKNIALIGSNDKYFNNNYNRLNRLSIININIDENKIPRYIFFLFKLYLIALFCMVLLIWLDAYFYLFFLKL